MNLIASLARSLPLLAATALLMAGTGLGSSVLGIRSGTEGFSTVATGIILSGYYGGFLAGSLLIPALIERVGHVRVFAGLASLASAAVLVHVVLIDPLGWWLLRLITGLCMAGLFVVTETWLNATATNRSRGQILAAYMIVVTGGLAVGQLLLNVASPAGFTAFILASVLVSLAVVPVALVTVRAPDVPEPVPLSVREATFAAPLGVVGAAASGFAGAAVVGFGAVYAAAAGLSVGQTSVLLFGALVGAVVLQFPMGAVSDRVDRRAVIAGGAIVAGAASVVATLFDASAHFGALVVVTAFAGGISYPLYSLSSAHLNDYLAAGSVVAAGARLVLLNGSGAVAGPLVAALAIEAFDADGFFYVLAFAYACTGGFALYRMTRRAGVSNEARSVFVALPSGAAPSVATLVPDAGPELYPETEGDVVRDGVSLHWRERGHGLAVVLVHGAGSSSLVWDESLVALASSGFRAVAFDLRGHGASTRAPTYELSSHVDDLQAVLDDRTISGGVLVGLGAGAAIVVDFAVAQPARVSGLVLVSATEVFGPDASGRPPIRQRVDETVRAALRGVVGKRAASSLRASSTYGRRRAPLRHRRLSTDLRVASRQAIAGTRAAAHEAAGSPRLAHVRAPVLWVDGSHVGHAPGPDAVLIPDAGHFVPLDQPEAFVDAVAPFLRQAERRTLEATTGAASE